MRRIAVFEQLFQLFRHEIGGVARLLDFDKRVGRAFELLLVLAAIAVHRALERKARARAADYRRGAFDLRLFEVERGAKRVERRL